MRASASAGAKALPGQIRGVDLNTERQLALVSEFRQFVAELPFEAGPTTRTRYYYDNGYYSYIDAMTLYCMIRYVKPNKVIEIGSVSVSYTHLTLPTTERV